MYLSRSPFGTLMKFEALLSLNSCNTNKKNIQIPIFPTRNFQSIWIPLFFFSKGMSLYFPQWHWSLGGFHVGHSWSWSYGYTGASRGFGGGLGIPEMVHSNSLAARNLAKNSAGRRNPSQILVTTINSYHFYRIFEKGEHPKPNICMSFTTRNIELKWIKPVLHDVNKWKQSRLAEQAEFAGVFKSTPAWYAIFSREFSPGFRYPEVRSSWASEWRMPHPKYVPRMKDLLQVRVGKKQ